MERDAHLQSLFYLPTRVPSKGALPPSSLDRAPIEMPHLQSPFSHLSKSLVDKPTAGCPTGPHEERCPSPEPSFHNPGYPVMEAWRPSSVSLFRGRCPIPRAPFIHLSKFPLDGLPSPGPPTGPLYGETPIPEPYSTHKPPAYEPSVRPPWKEVPISRAFFYTSRFPLQSSQKERCSISRALLLLSQSPINRPPPQVPQWDPYGDTHPRNL